LPTGQKGRIEGRKIRVDSMDSLRNALFRALDKSHLPMLRSCLSLGVSPAFLPGDEMPVFHAALSAPFVDLEVLKTLEEAGADPAMRSPFDLSGALHMAIALPEPEVLDWLLAERLDVNMRTGAGETPLIWAAQAPEDEDADPRHAEWALRDARTLIAAGAEIDITDDTGRTALHYAAEAGSEEMVALLLLAGADVARVDGQGDTPLHLAVGKGHDPAARALLEAGADPNVRNNKGCNCLHQLADLFLTDMTPAHLRLANALLAAGGDLGALDHRGLNPLVAAAATGNIPVAAVFVSRGAKVDAENGAALRQALLFEDDDMTDLLLKAGAAPGLAGEDGERPLHLAAQEGFVHGVRALLNHGADIETRNIDGETPLLVAVRMRRYDVAALLIERGADVASRDQYGNTAEALADQRRDVVLKRLLASVPVVG
jgi:ankyrin repeat protein